MSSRPLLAMAALVTFLAACNGPLPFLSGGALDGPVVEAPASWADFGEPNGLMELETNPADPYSVNLAYTIVGETLYAYAGDTRTAWVEHMEADPRVRMRIDDSIYELRAERVHDEAEIVAFAKAWTAQGSYHRDPMELEDRWLYRLARR